ncbi:RxLR effector protein [Phytophthora megakarya]|uniref:RxLR effector protein n=1 Tax=Phytophthora megakarya TaxID=4795 RepID=A0A225UTQ3_9STRA|nr:RxLR effector protein [Phytophthora megakarya]
MSALCLLLLILLEAINADSMSLQNYPTQHTLSRKEKNVTRLMRKLDTVDVSKTWNGSTNTARSIEERTGISSAIVKITYNQLLKTNTHPEKYFKRIRLAKANVKLEDNSGVAHWLHYVKLYRDKNRGDHWFTDEQIINLLRNSKPETELVSFFQSLRQIPDMETFADALQRSMVLNSASSHKVMNNVWLKSRETPEEVFNILRLKDKDFEDNPLFIQWLRYAKLYGREVLAKFNVDTKLLGVELQTIKQIPDLTKFAQNIQTHLFRSDMNIARINPEDFGILLAIQHPGWRYTLNLPKTNPMYATLKAYTLQYAAERGGHHLFKQVKGLFANNEPGAAITAAMKA